MNRVSSACISVVFSLLAFGPSKLKADAIYGKVGEWSVLTDSGTDYAGCFMATGYLSDIYLGVGVYQNISNLRYMTLILHKETWRLASGELGAVQVSVDGRDLRVVGSARTLPTNQGFRVLVEASTATSDAIRFGNTLRVRTPNQVYTFDLTGTASALVETARCTAEEIERNGLRPSPEADSPFPDPSARRTNNPF